MLEANAVYRDPAAFRALSDDRQAEIESSKSSELHTLTDALLRNGWHVYWGVLADIELACLHYHAVYDVMTGASLELSNTQLNERINVVLARILGSVEGKLATVKRYFECLRDSFAGIAINDPASAIYGLRKDYLFELINAGFPTITTDYYENTVTFAELEEKYDGALDRHIVKPVTGELSNSLRVLAETSEQFFRHKEPLVGGWLVQPVRSEIWCGEYQLFYLGDVCTHANKKVYRRSDEHPIIPSQENRHIEEYAPADPELELARDLKRFYRDRLGLHTDIFRLDFIKDAAGAPIIVEFETVNPGFFIKYVAEHRRIAIANDFEALLRRRRDGVR